MPPTMDFEAYYNEEVGGEPFDIPALLRMEDEAGVEVAVVMPANQSAKTRQTYLRPDNLRVARAIQGNPRCIGCATINPTFGEAAVADLRMMVTEWGFKGVKLMATLHRYVVDDPDVDAVLQVARELGLVVSIHSGPDEVHPNRIGHVAARFPDLPIIMDHMGYPDATEEAIRVAEEHPRVYLGTTILRFFRADPSQADPTAVAEAVRRLGPERVVFGSNLPEYPHSALWGHQAIERLRLGPAAEKLIFGTNLARLYGLA
ncbi:MAG: amidohydrolase [Chloroflexi bacterium]|nr:amidohydrolase [Chloroflexota bacterium]